MELEFFMPMRHVPTITHQEHKVMVNKKTGRPIFYEPPELKAARADLKHALWPHCPKGDEAVKTISKGTPVALQVQWCFGFEGNTHNNGDYRVTKPDTDNLQKMLKDVMTECGFWEDDAQVVYEVTSKYWADVPGIYVKLWTLQEVTQDA